MENNKFVENQFYWDDMEGYPYSGIYQPSVNWNGFSRPFLKFAEIIRFRDFLEIEYSINSKSARIRFHKNMMIEYYYDNGKRVVIIPFSWKGNLYYEAHEMFEWNAVKEY